MLRESLLELTSSRRRSPRVPLLQPTAVRPERGLRAPVLVEGSMDVEPPVELSLMLEFDEGSMDVEPPVELSLVLEFDAANSSTPPPEKLRQSA